MKLKQKIVENGFFRTFFSIYTYFRHHLIEKWKFVYFELDLGSPPFSLPDRDSSLKIRKANYRDIEKIKLDLYPHMGEKQDFDKRYINQIGTKNCTCFIAEVDKKLIHYFMVFDSANNSPLMQTPFDQNNLFESDAYIGNAFTVKGSRGQSVTTYVLLEVIKYLQEEKNIMRAILLVHTDTPGAVGFYSRLGFKVIKNAESKTLSYRFLARN
jgi:ribosomal protein S18 acetylase RimI-like enzyme